MASSYDLGRLKMIFLVAQGSTYPRLTVSVAWGLNQIGYLPKSLFIPDKEMTLESLLPKK